MSVTDRHRVRATVSDMNTAPAHLTIPAAAEHANVSVATIRRRIYDGTLTRYRRPGARRAVLISVEELEAAFTLQAD